MANTNKTIVLKARRDTLVLVAAVVSVTFALSYSIHSRPVAARDDGTPQHQAWAGGLADLAPVQAMPVGPEPLTSASLVVPKSQLSLPQPPMRTLIKLHGCEGDLCATKPGVPLPARRPSGAEKTVASKGTGQATDKPSLLARFNPLTHLPDAKVLGRPFSVAGDTVTGWFKRF